MSKYSRREIQHALDELLAEGLIEIKGWRDGEPVYVATDKEHRSSTKKQRRRLRRLN